jgi:hypothetical protein
LFATSSANAGRKVIHILFFFNKISKEESKYAAGVLEELYVNKAITIKTIIYSIPKKLCRINLQKRQPV